MLLKIIKRETSTLKYLKCENPLTCWQCMIFYNNSNF
jgi:hypothetical protein